MTTEELRKETQERDAAFRKKWAAMTPEERRQLAETARRFGEKMQSQAGGDVVVERGTENAD